MSSIQQAHSAAGSHARAPFPRVLVPLDLGREADRALPVGAALARRLCIDLDVACVTSPHLNPLEEEAEIRRHAQSLDVEVDRVLLAYDEDAVEGLLAERDATDGLLCCATHARHVVEVGDDGIPRGRYPTAERTANYLVQRGLDATWVVLPDGHTARDIVEFAGQLDDPFVVAGTHGRRRHSGAPLGDVVRDVVRQASCPVLVVPPHEDQAGRAP